MNKDAAIKKSLDIVALAVESDAFIKADDRRTTQIFVNLLSNAIKFTPEGGKIGADIAVNTSANNVAIAVWDTGIGISEEHIEHVFEKFHQVTEHIYSRKQEGTGLGLHISRELARKMGGDITLVSVEGEGSRFTVTLPLATGTVSDDDNFI
ncbi:sensor histidine kinase [Kordiimonas gwangyangensis]|nr:ATP-binding protein [Kordiimonas gwangyangensis]